MKQTVFGVILTIIVIIILGCNMTVNGRSVRQNELNLAVNQAVEQTVEELVQEEWEENRTVSNEALAADLAEGILTGIESDADIQIDILACDAEKGLLSVRATAHYKHINGNEGTVSATRTVILEQYKA